MIYQGDEFLFNPKINLVTFREDRVPKTFFKNAALLNYHPQRTMKYVFTHEMFCTKEEFVALLEISKQDEESK